MLANQSFPFTLNYRPNQAEQLEAARRYQATTRKHLFYRALSIASCGVVLWSIANGMQLLAIIWLILALYTWFDPIPLLLAWIGSRGGKDAPPYDATFADKGITFVIGDKPTQRNWERYTKLIETPNLFLLIYGSWAYSIVPRRAIGDTAAQERFKALVQGKLVKR
jgi:YcxB-like protein